MYTEGVYCINVDAYTCAHRWLWEPTCQSGEGNRLRMILIDVVRPYRRPRLDCPTLTAASHWTQVGLFEVELLTKMIMILCALSLSKIVSTDLRLCFILGLLGDFFQPNFWTRPFWAGASVRHHLAREPWLAKDATKHFGFVTTCENKPLFVLLWEKAAAYFLWVQSLAKGSLLVS